MGIVPFHSINLNLPLSQQHLWSLRVQMCHNTNCNCLARHVAFPLIFSFLHAFQQVMSLMTRISGRRVVATKKAPDGNFYNYSLIISIDCLLSGWSPIWNKDTFVTLTRSFLFVIYRDLSSIVLPISCRYWTCNFVRHFLHNQLSVCQSSPPFYESLYSSDNM